MKDNVEAYKRIMAQGAPLTPEQSFDLSKYLEEIEDIVIVYADIAGRLGLAPYPGPEHETAKQYARACTAAIRDLHARCERAERTVEALRSVLDSIVDVAEGRVDALEEEHQPAGPTPKE